MAVPFMPIQPISSSVTPISGSPQKIAPQAQESAGGSFQSMFMNALGSVSDTMGTAGEMTQKLMTGEISNLHDVTVSGSKAKIMLHLATRISSMISTACTTLFQMQL